MATRSSKRLKTQREAVTIAPVVPPVPSTARTFPNETSAAATDEDRKKWKGWCEIESEPAIFNVMLRQFGVQGVKVQEIFSLDDEMLNFLPRPVYGIVFLFKWREDDPANQESCCPSNVWFANQTVSNACASVSLLNIVNNAPDVDLGEHLRSFKSFTADMTPALRGYTIGNFEFIRQIHNSFARKMDMLTADLQMKNDLADSRKRKREAQDEDEDEDEEAEDEDEDEAAFHFIAFLPVDGTIWELDGLERYPHKVGPVEGGDWIQQVKAHIQSRMAQYEEGQIEFAILSLVKDPLIRLNEELASNVKSLQTLSAHLDKIEPDWQAIGTSLTDEDNAALEGTLYGPNDEYSLNEEAIASAAIPSETEQKLATSALDALLQYRHSLMSAQKGLRVSITEEHASNHSDEEKAAERQHDYGPAIQALLRFHARKSALKTIFNSG